MSRETSTIPTEDLLDPIARRGREALYGASAIAHELALRQRVEIDLRGDDDEPADDWEAARRAAGVRFDPVASAGLYAVLTSLGNPNAAQNRGDQQETNREKQRHRWVIALGGHVRLRNGAFIREGEPITLEQINHPHAGEVMQALVDRCVVSQIEPHVAWLRGLDPSVGPYVATRDLDLRSGKRLRRGDACGPDDFEPLKLPRRLSNDERLSDLTVADLRRAIADEIDRRIPRDPKRPPPMSEMELAQSTHAIELAPAWIAPSAPAPAATATAKRGGK